MIAGLMRLPRGTLPLVMLALFGLAPFGPELHSPAAAADGATPAATTRPTGDLDRLIQ